MKWAKIDTLHSVSDEGQVKNDETGHFLSIWIDAQTGYPRVRISRGAGCGTNYYIHRLVAEKFIPNPENKPEVNHINGDRADCRIENLEWVTHRENHIHKCKVLNHVSSTVAATQKRRKPVRCVETGVSYNSVRAAAEAIGVGHQYISAAVLKGKLAGGYHWEVC